MAEAQSPIITLASGRSIKIQRIQLVDEVPLMEAAQIRAEAHKALGSGGGLGVLGSPLSGAFYLEVAAVGLLSKMLAGSGQKAAADLLGKSNDRMAAAMQTARMFKTSEIRALQSAEPAHWVGMGDKRPQKHDLSAMSEGQKSAFFVEHGIPYQAGGKVQVNVPARFVHPGGDFVLIESDDMQQYIRWSAVESYQLAKLPAVTLPMLPVNAE